MTASETYKLVCDHARETALLNSANAVLEWDERTQLPPGGSEYRAEQTAYLAGLIHQRQTDAKFGEWLAELSESELASGDHGDTAINIARLKRLYDRKTKLPNSLVRELTRTAVRGQHIWEEARRNNDFGMFVPLLDKTIHLKQQQADALGYQECRYDALLDDFEPFELTSNVASVLEGFRKELVPLVESISASSARPNEKVLRRNYSVDGQGSFGKRVAQEIGFDFHHGRLDRTAHPFCTALGPKDCRITTRFDERFFPSAFFSILHEAGHGMYDQGLRPDNFGLPAGEAISLGIHESQSRMWENMVGRSRAFWEHYFPTAKAIFPDALGDVGLDEFHFAVNSVEPSLIRVEADEVTYNLHILVRFELEQALVNGELGVNDLPGAWNEKYQSYLGVTPPNDADGVLQDIHWSAGLIGYFATYTLGNLYAAHFFRQADSDLGGLEEQFRRGGFQSLLGWLRQKIHSRGQCYTAAELVQDITGKPLSHRPFMEYLQTKYGALYEIG